MSSLMQSLKKPRSGRGSNRASVKSKGLSDLNCDDSMITGEKILAESAYWVRYPFLTAGLIR
jgi:hypothetical protein